MKLGPAAAAAGCRLTVFETIGSTQAAALAAAHAGDAGLHWFAALEQTAGRGRAERRWLSPKGNLHATLLLVDACPARHAAKLGFAAGTALREAVLAAAPGLEGLTLKWPNDLLINGAKCAGLLLEGSMLPGGRHAVAIGIGVNCAAHPPETPYPAAHLSQFAPGLTAPPLFAALSDAFAAVLAQFDHGAGFEPIRQRWLAHAHGIGQPITARLHEGERRGVFETIDAEGRLVLRGAEGAGTITAGDVFFGL